MGPRATGWLKTLVPGVPRVPATGSPGVAAKRRTGSWRPVPSLAGPSTCAPGRPEIQGPRKGRCGGREQTAAPTRRESHSARQVCRGGTGLGPTAACRLHVTHIPVTTSDVQPQEWRASPHQASVRGPAVTPSPQRPSPSGGPGAEDERPESAASQPVAVPTAAPPCLSHPHRTRSSEPHARGWTCP